MIWHYGMQGTLRVGLTVTGLIQGTLSTTSQPNITTMTNLITIGALVDLSMAESANIHLRRAAIKFTSAGGTPTILDYYESGTGTLNWSGPFTALNVPYYFTRLGKNVTIAVTQVIVNSNNVTANYLTTGLTLLPARLRPGFTIFSNTSGSNNSAAALISCGIENTGVVICGTGNRATGVFTAETPTTNCGFYAWTISYVIL